MEVLREKQLRLLQSAKNKTDLAKIITGMRRVGKSTLLKQFRSTLSKDDNIVFLNLDAHDEIKTQSDLKKCILDGFTENKIHYVFIDEVQNVDG